MSVGRSVSVSFCLCSMCPCIVLVPLCFNLCLHCVLIKKDYGGDEIEVSKIRIMAENIFQSTFCCIYSMPHIGNSLSGVEKMVHKLSTHTTLTKDSSTHIG